MTKFLVAVGALVLVVVLFFSLFTTRVPTGYTGIMTTFGKVEDQTLEAGFHMKSLFQGVVLMDNREQRIQFVTQAFSADIQQVDVIGSINYSINKSTAMTLYTDVGTGYTNTLITPRLLETTKAIFSKYSAEDLVESRGVLSVKIKDALGIEMDKYGINILSVSIEDIDFTDAFTNAVESKQVAEQTKLQVETEQAQQVSIEKASAERKMIAAEADANVAKINADTAAYTKKVQAEAEAEANAKIAASITDALIEYEKINKWNGSVPQVQTGDGGDMYPIIDMTE